MNAHQYPQNIRYIAYRTHEDFMDALWAIDYWWRNESSSRAFYDNALHFLLAVGHGKFLWCRD